MIFDPLTPEEKERLDKATQAEKAYNDAFMKLCAILILKREKEDPNFWTTYPQGPALEKIMNTVESYLQEVGPAKPSQGEAEAYYKIIDDRLEAHYLNRGIDGVYIEFEKDAREALHAYVIPRLTKLYKIRFPNRKHIAGLLKEELLPYCQFFDRKKAIDQIDDIPRLLDVVALEGIQSLQDYHKIVNTSVVNEIRNMRLKNSERLEHLKDVQIDHLDQSIKPDPVPLYQKEFDQGKRLSKEDKEKIKIDAMDELKKQAQKIIKKSGWDGPLAIQEKGLATVFLVDPDKRRGKSRKGKDGKAQKSLTDMDDNTAMVLDDICIALAQKLPYHKPSFLLDANDITAEMRTVSFTVKKFMDDHNIKNVYQARQILITACMWLNDLYVVYFQPITYEKMNKEGISRKETALRRWISKVIDAWEIGEDGKTINPINKGVFSVKVHEEFANYLRQSQYMYYPDWIRAIDKHKNPHSYHIFLKLWECYNMNAYRGKPVRIKVRNLLNAIPTLPPAEEVRKGTRDLTRRIIEPFERDLIALHDELGILQEWHYCNRGGVPLTDKQELEQDFDDWCDNWYIEFSFTNYPKLKDRKKDVDKKKRRAGQRKRAQMSKVKIKMEDPSKNELLESANASFIPPRNKPKEPKK